MRSVLNLSGELDYACVDAWWATIDATLQQKPSTLVLDVGEVTFIDSSGLSLLVSTRARCVEQSTTLELRSPPPAFRRLLHLTGLEGVLLTVDGADNPI